MPSPPSRSSSSSPALQHSRRSDNSLLESSHSSHSSFPPVSFAGEPCYPGPCLPATPYNPPPFPAGDDSPPPVPVPVEAAAAAAGQKAESSGGDDIDTSAHYLAKVKEAPQDLGDKFSCPSCRVSNDRRELNRVMDRVRYRQQSLEAQDNWLHDATNAIENLKREMGSAQTQRDNTQSDLNTLYDLKQRLTMQIRSDQLKRDLDEAKQTLGDVKEKQQSLIDYKSELKAKKDDLAKKIGTVEKKLKDLPPVKPLQLEE